MSRKVLWFFWSAVSLFFLLQVNNVGTYLLKTFIVSRSYGMGLRWLAALVTIISFLVYIVTTISILVKSKKFSHWIICAVPLIIALIVIYAAYVGACVEREKDPTYKFPELYMYNYMRRELS